MVLQMNSCPAINFSILRQACLGPHSCASVFEIFDLHFISVFISRCLISVVLNGWAADTLDCLSSAADSQH